MALVSLDGANKRPSLSNQVIPGTVNNYHSPYRSLRRCVGGRGKSLSPSGGGGGASEGEEPKLETLLPNMVVCGTIEFKMDKKSYRMIPLANSEDYLYNMAALTKAKEVSPFRLPPQWMGVALCGRGRFDFLLVCM